MRKRSSLATLVFMLLVAPVLALSQAGQESRTLIVNGQPGQVAVVQMNGHSTSTSKPWRESPVVHSALMAIRSR
jgi:hypothetical protein